MDWYCRNNYSFNVQFPTQHQRLYVHMGAVANLNENEHNYFRMHHDYFTCPNPYAQSHAQAFPNVYQIEIQLSPRL